jgi:hypothetical protein
MDEHQGNCGMKPVVAKMIIPVDKVAKTPLAQDRGVLDPTFQTDRVDSHPHPMLSNVAGGTRG